MSQEQTAEQVALAAIQTVVRMLMKAVAEGRDFTTDNRAGVKPLAPKDGFARWACDGAEEFILRVAPGGQMVEEYPFPIKEPCGGRPQ